MTTIDDWAKHWCLEPSNPMVLDLKRRMGIAPTIDADTLPTDPEHSEGYQQSLVRLEAARKGIRLFRNNSGAFKNPETGQLVRYGLANDSAQLNKVLKSPDLVGWRKRLITPDMVGSIIGQACMREMKHESWTYKGDAHERAQLAFIELAVADGCDASFATGPGTL